MTEYRVGDLLSVDQLFELPVGAMFDSAGYHGQPTYIRTITSPGHLRGPHCARLGDHEHPITSDLHRPPFTLVHLPKGDTMPHDYPTAGIPDRSDYDSTPGQPLTVISHGAQGRGGPGPLLEAVNESDRQLDRVDELLQVLRERLDVVTRGHEPTAPSPETMAVKAPPPVSVLTGRARDVADRIRRIGDRIDDLLPRLEV